MKYFLFLVMFFLLTLGCERSQPGQAKGQLQPDNWQQLCAVKACQDYPSGYLTVEFDGNLLYFPLDLDILRCGFQGKHFFKHKDILGSDQYQKVYLHRAKSLEANTCMRSMYRAFDLLNDVPKNIKPFGGGYNFYANSMHDSRYKDSIKTHDVGGYTDILENFYIVNVGIYLKNTDGWGRRQISLISKVPMFFNNHVFISCSTVCSISSLGVDGPESNLPFGFKISNVRYDYQAVDCDDPSPLLNCDENVEILDEFALFIKQHEYMFKKAMMKPIDK